MKFSVDSLFYNFSQILYRFISETKSLVQNGPENVFVS